MYSMLFCFAVFHEKFITFHLKRINNISNNNDKNNKYYVNIDNRSKIINPNKYSKL